MSKRDPQTDIPRRIYKSTIDRIDKHLLARMKPAKTRRKMVKMDFNLFLIELLNVYEELKTVPLLYANDLYESVEEARGAEILQAAKEKRKPRKALTVISIGEDDV
jgi:hypothetical protein